jgi:PAS domain S-box-containing protein
MVNENSLPGGTRDLLERERRFRLLVQGVIDYAIFMLDPNGIIVNWNAGAERIKGYKASEVVGKHFGMFYTPEDRDGGLPEAALETARARGRFETEGWRVRKDGTRFLASAVIDAIYEDGRLIGFAKITRDVTERYKTQKALEDSERRFRLLVSNVIDYAVFMLDPQGNVASWNAGAMRIKGYMPEEIIGQHFSRFYTEEDRAAGRPARALSIAQTTGHYQEDGWRVRKDGSFFWASVVIDPIYEDGRLVGFAKITRDISERREAQLALAKVERQLAESQKMDALGQITGGVAHDFNNLLMIVSGHLQTIKRLSPEEPKLQRAIQAIEIASKRGAALTSQLLSFARRQRVNPQAVSVEERISAVREVLNSGLGSGFTLTLDIPPDIWPISVDTSEFEMALVNLVINARDAMSRGGTVTVKARNIYSRDAKELFVAISVTDTGSGIAPDVLNKVFDPFFTTKPVGKGTGLGLSQVHGFVHQAGGTVKIGSTLGEGTTVTMTFPRAVEQPEQESGREDDALTRRSGTVLLVEDNPDVAGASGELLQQLGYTVRWVADASSALQEIELNGIDIVFSDIVMPGGMDGIVLAQTIREKHPHLPILLTTGYSQAAHKGGRADFPILQKPFQIHELSRALTEATR